MRLDQETFFRILGKISSQVKLEADNTSSWSDLSQWKYSPEWTKTAQRAELALVGLSLLYLNPDQENQIRDRFLKIASHFRNEGEWNRVREICLLPTFAPFPVLEYFLEKRSPEDFFGNDLRYILKFLKNIQLHLSYTVSDHPVKKPKRKRGYDDKGHLSKNPRLPRPPYEPEEPDPVYSVTSTTWWEDIDPNLNIKAQETLMRINSSRTEKGGKHIEKPSKSIKPFGGH